MSASDSSEELMKGLMYKLYKTVTGCDSNIKIPRNKFISWLMPGIPFAPEEFRYCQTGFSAGTAQQIIENYHNAFMLSKLLDFVPEIPEPTNENNQFKDTTKLMQTVFLPNQDSISSVWRDVLQFSRVVNLELSAKEQEKLQKFRDKLIVTKEVIDIVTEEKKMVSEPGPLTRAYTTKMAEYTSAADEYYDLLIDAQSATGDDAESKRRVQEFANRARNVRRKMDAAYMAWVTDGYRNEYEQIAGYIEQVTQKSMVLYKQDLQRKLEQAILTSPNDGNFYYTTLTPGNFAVSPGWTRFSYYQKDYESNYRKDNRSWGGSTTLNFGLFSLGGNATGSSVEEKNSSETSNFNASLEFTQVPIVRPWFDPAFFLMRGWDLDKTWDLNYPGKKISNGEQIPSGRLVAYSISALFVRNVSFKFDEAQSQSSWMNEQISGGGKIGWGPFSIGGSSSSATDKRDSKFNAKGGEISIPGMQLIGLVNNLVPTSPNLDPRIKPTQLV